MRGKVKYASRIIMSALAHKHIAKLADGRVGQYAFNIKLEQSDSGREERGYATYDCYGDQRGMRHLEQGIATGHKAHTTRAHRCRCNKGPDNRRAIHSIRKPPVQSKLSRLAC